MCADRGLILILLGSFACVPCVAQPRTVALTFDDLPAAGATTAAQAERLNSRILRSLRKRSAPATGFVVEKEGQEIGAPAWDRILRAWVRNGHELGNHTYSHADPNELTAAEFEAEVVSGESSFAKVLAENARRPRFLRFPYNHSGGSKDALDAAAAFLQARGYTIAACTIDNSDYEFSRAYKITQPRSTITAVCTNRSSVRRSRT
jgi:peptidoglycan/xylan/chitin deacetylase (PgdA/CDA1 family)